jgi:hypothetical protein
MRPLATMPREEAARIEALLFDLDDTVLTHGRLTREAFDAICDLADAGLTLVAVTGRPAGWGEIVARQWPVEGVVAENGAVLLHREGAGVVRDLRLTGTALAASRARLAQIVAKVRSAVPEIELADDNAARLTDVTFDVGERHELPADRIALARATIVAEGARATLSSVHLHASLEGDDKASGVFRFLSSGGSPRRRIDSAQARVRCAFVGDSENDAACFAAFATTVGVANVAPWVARLSLPPRYVTRGAMGAGFAELARTLLAARAPAA